MVVCGLFINPVTSVDKDADGDDEANVLLKMTIDEV
jgi:hypothetical protein